MFPQHTLQRVMNMTFIKWWEVLIKNNSLNVIPGRKLSQFKNFDRNLLHRLDWKMLPTWIDRKKREILTYKYALVEGNL